MSEAVPTRGSVSESHYHFFAVFNGEKKCIFKSKSALFIESQLADTMPNVVIRLLRRIFVHVLRFLTLSLPLLESQLSD